MPHRVGLDHERLMSQLQDALIVHLRSEAGGVCMGLSHALILSVVWTYLPMQKLEKITPNKSSDVNSPVMVLRAF